jgi:hypothetical protein
LYLSLQGIPYASDDVRTTNIEGVACSWPRHCQNFGSKACLSSVLHYLDDNMVKAIQLEYLLRLYVSCKGKKE